MIPRYDNLDRVTGEHIQQLLNARIPESEELEYKQEAYSSTTLQEWHKDASALANGNGGCILIGVEEKEHCAASLRCIDQTEADEIIQQLASSAESGIEPRIAIRFRQIPIDAAQCVIVIAIPPSRFGPHRVRRSRQFHKRVGTITSDMDYSELKHRFLRSKEPELQASEVHAQSLTYAKQSPTLVLDFVPADLGNDYFNPADRDANDVCFRSLQRLSLDAPEIDFFGFIKLDESRGRGTHFRRNGHITILIKLNFTALVDHESKRRMGGPAVCSYIAQAFASARDFTKSLRITPPVFACSSLVGCRAWTLLPDDYFGSPAPIQHDKLTLPPILLESADLEPDGTAGLLRPWLDRVYNASGLAKCDQYSPDGSPKERLANECR